MPALTATAVATAAVADAATFVPAVPCVPMRLHHVGHMRQYLLDGSARRLRHRHGDYVRHTQVDDDSSVVLQM